MSSAPMPANFDALSSAWDDPIRFAAELHTYYQQLERDGLRQADRYYLKEDA